MTDKYSDKRLIEDFRQLREAERQSLPAFESLLTPQGDSQKTRYFQRPARLALAASAVLIAMVILLNPSHNVPSVDDDIESNQYPVDLQMTLAYELPTDFLLDTPWFQLASTTPEFQVLTPTYEYLEE